MGIQLEEGFTLTVRSTSGPFRFVFVYSCLVGLVGCGVFHLYVSMHKLGDGPTFSGPAGLPLLHTACYSAS